MAFPRSLVLGSNGRIGTLLRHVWSDQRPAKTGARADRILWQSRSQTAGCAVFDPLAEPEALRAAARDRQVILCLAGVIRPGPGRTLDDNTRLALAALEAAQTAQIGQADGQADGRADGRADERAGGAHVFLLSSAAVYGRPPSPSNTSPSGARSSGPGSPRLAQLCLAEHRPLTPLSPYGRAKAAMEAASLAANLQAGPRARLTILRVGNIAGLDAVLGGWRPGFALDRFPDGRTPRRSYIGPLTLARVLAGLMAAAAQGTALPRVLNIAAPGLVEMGALLDAAGRPWRPRRAGRAAIPVVHLNTARLAAHIPVGPAAAHPARLVAEWRQARALGALAAASGGRA